MPLTTRNATTRIMRCLNATLTPATSRVMMGSRLIRRTTQLPASANPLIQCAMACADTSQHAALKKSNVTRLGGTPPAHTGGARAVYGVVPNSTMNVSTCRGTCGAVRIQTPYPLQYSFLWSSSNNR